MTYNISSFDGKIPFSIGYIPDLPSSSDYTPETKKISELVNTSFEGIAGIDAGASASNTKADISRFDSLIKDQTNIGACVGMGTTGNMESFIRKKFNVSIVLSPRYSYKITRYSMGELYNWNDSGAFIRSGFGAAVTHGVAPERYWPWMSRDNTIRNQWNDVPDQLAIPYAMNYRIRKYARLDPIGYTAPETLAKVKASIGIDQNPVTFGFTCFSSLFSEETTKTGKIRMRQPIGDEITGGHCVLAVGYDDTMNIAGKTGALKIKNSWNTKWGEAGYGWLPYAYILEGAAADFWVILDMDFQETKPFSM